STVPEFKTTPVDAAFVEKQKKILSLFYNVNEISYEAEYYKVAQDFNIEASKDCYTNMKAYENFMMMYKVGFLPKNLEFSIFYEKMREEAIALFKLFYYAKDFECFYKTACYARVYMNQGMFLYAYYIAIIQRSDTASFVLPAPYEAYPQYFVNMEVKNKMDYVKMMDGCLDEKICYNYGIIKENEQFVMYANYSNSLTYPNNEDRIAYLTEDVGLNAYYYYFHSHLPFWWNSGKYGAFKERRGEIYFFFYQQLLARYYMERLTNGLGKIPEFSWYSPLRTGYLPPFNSFYYPFAQRSNDYELHTEKNYEEIRFLDIYEKTFFQYLQQGHFKAFDKKIDLHSSKAVNFVGNYWQTNADLFEEDFLQFYQRSYEVNARRVLGAAPKPFNQYTFIPSALDFYQTSARDPAFYQLYKRIVQYIIEFKQYQVPYTQEALHFVGLKISDVKVDKMVTFFDHFDFDAFNTVYFSKEELKSSPHGYKVRQPRLNHKPFTVTIDIKSDVATNAVVKMFLGPKYDENGFPFSLEDNWMNFYELDWFVQKVNPGQSQITRSSTDFAFFKEDSLPMAEIYKLLDQGKIPTDMFNSSDTMPSRLMLPKGTYDGFPFQLFVFVYPYEPTPKESEPFKAVVPDNKPFGYPFDRPVLPQYFKQPNMFFKKVLVYHEGELFPYLFNIPHYTPDKAQL
nr:Chain A, Silkworm storage protein [Bombyx mori]